MKNTINISSRYFLFFLSFQTILFAQSLDISYKNFKRANSLKDQGKYLEAAQLYAKTAEAEIKNPSIFSSDLHINLFLLTGVCYFNVGQYDKAIGYYDKALSIARKKFGQEDKIAISINNIGMVYEVWGHYNKAIDCFEQSLVINRKLGKEAAIIEDLNNIGAVYDTLAQYDKAIDYYKQALTINRKLENEAGIVKNLNNIGFTYKAWGELDKAINHFEQALSIVIELGQETEIASCLENIGTIYNSWGHDDKAKFFYEQALNAINLFKETDIATDLNKIGTVYNSWAQYDKAINYYEQALIIDRKLGKESAIATYLNNIGVVYEIWAQYDKSIDYYEQALTVTRKSGQEDKISHILNNIGGVYNSWGQYDKAFDYYKQAVTIARKLGQEDKISHILNNIGSVYYCWGQYDKAFDYCEQALVIDRKLGKEAAIANYLNNIGVVYEAWAQYDKAIDYFKQALAIDRKFRNEAYIARDINNIGSVYYYWGQYDKAFDYCEQALVIDRRLGKEAAIATDLNNIGVVYEAWAQYDKAINHYEESVILKEKLRKTAIGDVRRDYLASQICTYQFLVSTYFKNNDLINSIQTIELSRAKLLAERIVGSDSAESIPFAKDVQSNITQDNVFIIYANADLEDKIILTMKHDKITGKEVPEALNLSPLLEKHGQAIKTIVANLRGFKIVTKQEEYLISSVKDTDDFKNIIYYYYTLLVNPSHENIEKTKELGRLLYTILIEPIKKEIVDIKELFIIPDGILAFLPFETLIDENGKYLAEKYNIKYAHSLGVLDLIKRRHYDKNRKSMLAFGGAVYDEISYNADMIENDRQFAYFEKNVLETLENRGSVREAYGALDKAHWQNIPGTLTEVHNIQTIIPDANIITGDQVTENEIKELSESGELAKYKVIHFATHGLTVPELPELSALVLSQFNEEKNGEDGYLRMNEIAALKIRADFVNLSACETGLGKIYGGEGVVGLTQSFLIAGANALSVSLWNVADESTAKLMTAMYKLVEEKGMDYAEAMAEVKRQFIRGDFGEKYKSPYYWAPFVYYGK